MRQRSISLLERGLAGIRDVVRSALVTYRADAANRSLKPADIDDLRLLIEPEVERRGIALDWHNDLADEVPVSAGAIRQAVLNLLLNACQASATGGRIRLQASLEEGQLAIQLTDNGPGLEPDRVRYLEDRELVVAPKPGEPGLGLWIIRRLVAETGGRLQVTLPADGGTTITIVVPVIMEGVRHVA